MVPVVLFSLMPQLRCRCSRNVHMIGPNTTLILVPQSPECDTCKLTCKSSIEIIIPSLSKCLANWKRKRHSSSSESFDSGLPAVKKPRRRTKKPGAKSNTSRLMIKIRLLQRQTATAADEKSDDGYTPDDEADDEAGMRRGSMRRKKRKRSHQPL
ncbi:hypothetical protein BDR07DRAFT_744278 [Suillus spraguei]|nr:hypothetical protein BDR07DRAFT_744278 [Suillus spraguei]